MKKAAQIYNKYILKIFLLFTVIISVLHSYFFVFVTKQATVEPDALARLNIARRVVDNITPGIAQIGGVWLPFPQVLYVPLVQVDYLYKSGLAGALVNGVAFVFCAYFVFKTIQFLTKNNTAAFIAGFTITTSTNLLFFQSTAMSESTVLAFLAGSVYYLVRWASLGTGRDLVKGALFVALVSFTRYEGYAVLGMSIPIITLVSLLKKRGWKKTEGNLVIFMSLACFGLFLWTIYLWAIFGDPLYWVNVYTHKRSMLSFETQQVGKTIDLVNNEVSFSVSKLFDTLVKSVKLLTNSIVEMNGLFVYILAAIGFFVAMCQSIKKRDATYLILLLLLAPFFFLMLNSVGGSVPIIAPQFSLSAIFDEKFVLLPEYNNRYGLQLLPFFAVCIGILSAKLKKFKFIVLLLVLTQFISVFYGYNLVFAMHRRIGSELDIYRHSIEWFNQNYDGGKVLVSVLSNDATLFHLNAPYKTFIFEGTGKYWLESMDDPARYATWLMFKKSYDKDGGFADRVAARYDGDGYLDREYDLVYDGELQIYKIKTRPKFILD